MSINCSFFWPWSIQQGVDGDLSRLNDFGHCNANCWSCMTDKMRKNTRSNCRGSHHWLPQVSWFVSSDFFSTGEKIGWLIDWDLLQETLRISAWLSAGTPNIWKFSLTQTNLGGWPLDFFLRLNKCILMVHQQFAAPTYQHQNYLILYTSLRWHQGKIQGRKPRC